MPLALPLATDKYDRRDQDKLRSAVALAVDDVAQLAPFVRGQITMPFTATPDLDASRAAVFVMTLTANVTSSTLSKATDGQPIRVVLKQDGVGARTFVWPTNMKGTMVISAGINTVSAQEFVYEKASGNAYATSPGVVGM